MLHGDKGGRLGSHLDKTVVVVSTGRTGTLALSHYLGSQFDDVTAVHEPKPSRRFRFISNVHHCGRLDTRRVANALYRARRARLSALHTDTYVESNPYLHGCLDALDQVFHNLHVVHIVRHPVSYAQSAIKNGVFTGAKGLGCRFCPYWMLKPEVYEPHSGKRWASMAPEERLVWRWSRVNASLDRGSTLLGNRYLRLRFEDLFDEKGSGLTELANWLQLDAREGDHQKAEAEQLNKGQSASTRPFHDWPGELHRSVHNLCGQQLEQYGYPSLDPNEATRRPG